MRIAPFPGLLLSCALVAQGPLQDPKPPRYEVREIPAMAELAGGSWEAVWNHATDTPRAIYGTGAPLVDWRENTLEEARRHATQALAKYGDVLRLGSSTFRESIGARMGRSWSFKFDQYFQGLPCIGGRADVRINMRGVLALIGSTAWQIPAGFDTTPLIGELEAQARAWLQLDQKQTDVAQPQDKRPNRLVVWGDAQSPKTAPFYLAWEIPVSNLDRSGNGPIGRFYVDARSGTVLRYENDKHECGFAGCRHPHHGAARAELPQPLPLPVPTTVTVMAWTRTPTLSAIGSLTNVPLVGLEVNVPGIGVRTTDQNGQFVIDISSPVTITVTNLDGRHCLPIGDNTPSLPNYSVNVTPGVPATLQLLLGVSGQDLVAHTSTFWWVDAVNEWARAIIGNTPQLDGADSVQPNVNVIQFGGGGQQLFCNAFYSGGANSVNFYPAGGGCNNTAFSSVVVHEWGHGLDDRYGGISNAGFDGLSEGWGDILGMYIGDNPVVGIDFRTNGSAVRTGNNTTTWPPPQEVHAAGQCWMGFAWMLREGLRGAFGTTQAIAISNDIVVGSIVADAKNQPDAVREVFIADDDDGNLQNGTPHYNLLSTAALARNLPFPVKQPLLLLHTPFGDTTQRYTPRMANVTYTPNEPLTLGQGTLFWSIDGGAEQSRPMVPGSAPNTLRAMLPSVSLGVVRYRFEVQSSVGLSRLPHLSDYFTFEVLPSNLQQFYLQTFDTPTNGYSHLQIANQDDWTIGTPTGQFGTSPPFNVPWADPLGAYSGLSCFGNDLGIPTMFGGDGSYDPNVENVLLSPPINCSGRTGVYLRFKRWLTVEEGIYDQATVEVNGAAVWTNQPNGHTIDTGWQTVTYRLLSADNNPSVQLGWRLRSDVGLELGGWNIDDVELLFEAPLPNTLTMTPEQSATGQTVTLNIKTGSFRLFVLILGDNPGPTSVPGFPTVDLGGNLNFLVDFSDIAGFYSRSFSSFAGMPAAGIPLYSQVLVFEAGNTFSISNPIVNLFTP